MRAAWYESQGSAHDVLVVGMMPDPHPGPGELRIAMAHSSINPGDVKKRSDAFGVGMPYPRVIPHSDGAGMVDAVGDGVSPDWIGARAWCFGAQSYRAFGTAAEFCVVPMTQVTRLPAHVPYEQGACLGIPALTAHRAVHVAGDVTGRAVLVQGGAGAVGLAAVAIARHAGATVVATVRSEQDARVARSAGAHEVARTDEASASSVVESLHSLAPQGFHHIVEVAFQSNIVLDETVLAQGGSIACYATNQAAPTIPFWNLVFKNVRLYFIGSDDFPPEAKRMAADDVTAMLADGWTGFPIRAVLPLEEIAKAHELVERGAGGGRVLLSIAH